MRGARRADDSEGTPSGYKKTKLNKTLLNGNNICVVRGARAR